MADESTVSNVGGCLVTGSTKSALFTIARSSSLGPPLHAWVTEKLGELLFMKIISLKVKLKKNNKTLF